MAKIVKVNSIIKAPNRVKLITVPEKDDTCQGRKKRMVAFEVKWKIGVVFCIVFGWVVGWGDRKASSPSLSWDPDVDFARTVGNFVLSSQIDQFETTNTSCEGIVLYFKKLKNCLNYDLEHKAEGFFLQLSVGSINVYIVLSPHHLSRLYISDTVFLILVVNPSKRIRYQHVPTLIPWHASLLSKGSFALSEVDIVSRWIHRNINLCAFAGWKQTSKLIFFSKFIFWLAYQNLKLHSRWLKWKAVLLLKFCHPSSKYHFRFHIPRVWSDRYKRNGSQ